MAKKITIGERLCKIREEMQLNQMDFADRIGMKRSAYSKVETNISGLSIDSLRNVAKISGKSYQYIIDGEELSQNQEGDVGRNLENVGKNVGFQPKNSENQTIWHENKPLEGIQEHLIDDSGEKIRILVISTDKSNNENIIHIPYKAVAGYAKNYDNPLYISELPAFQLPYLKEGTYKAIDIDGDSMAPLVENGDIALGRLIIERNRVQTGSICLIVTKNEGILCKKVEKGFEVLHLHSENKIYEKYTINKEDVSEIYLVVGIIRLWKKYNL
jgi:transcriptional regulator with XRE-family HTH domain